MAVERPADAEYQQDRCTRGSLSVTTPLPVSDDRPLWDIWLSSMHLPALAVAVELSIFETLALGPLTVAQLCERLELKTATLRNPAAYARFAGHVDQASGHLSVGPDRARLPAARQPLLLGPRVVGAGPPRNQIELREAIKLHPHAPELPVASGWESGQMSDELAGAVTRMMNSHSMGAAQGLARSGAVGGDQRLLDVGGGSGAFRLR